MSRTGMSQELELPEALLEKPATTEMAPAENILPVRILPPRGWELVNVGELWRFRELLFYLTWRDVMVRYKQTLLGAAWAVLQPALMMVVFTIFFGKMAKVPSGNVPYPLFAYAGLLPWTFFATAISQSGNSVVGSERIISKVYFPRLAIPLAAVGAAVVDFMIAFGLLIVLMFWYGVTPGPALLLLPLIFTAILLTALGTGIILAALNVAYRDFRYVIPFMVQLWMFGTPSVYMEPKAGGWLSLNPMTGLIGAFRAACLGGRIDWGQLAIASAAGVAILTIGCFYFRRQERTFADII